MYEVVTFFLVRGIPLETLINASEAEKIMYSIAKEKYFIDEYEKYKTLFDGNRR
ncbi:hypothetical protein [Clostridium thermopalmarium]|uniref:hypothetical protein n=1 Tax=Clostridium thermopalmarium TaxID=29373 RepID=UPI00235233A3|nr:hypothetical protein [Clostridium thermopalmarium]